MINLIAAETSNDWAVTVQMFIFLSFILAVVYMIWGRRRGNRT